MKRLWLGVAALLALPALAVADAHGWTREAGPEYRLADLPEAFVFLSATAMGDTLITLWERAPYEDAEVRDFLGNPLQVRRTFIRCVEERGADGLFRMQYCEGQ